MCDHLHHHGHQYNHHPKGKSTKKLKNIIEIKKYVWDTVHSEKITVCCFCKAKALDIYIMIVFNLCQTCYNLLLKSQVYDSAHIDEGIHLTSSKQFVPYALYIYIFIRTYIINIYSIYHIYHSFSLCVTDPNCCAPSSPSKDSTKISPGGSSATWMVCQLEGLAFKGKNS